MRDLAEKLSKDAARATRAAILIALVMMSSVSACQARPAQSDSLSAGHLYDDHRVAEIEITLPGEEWDRLRVQSRDFAQSMINPSAKPFDYFQAEIKIDGVVIPKVGIRKKGFLGSLDNECPSLRVKFDEFGGTSPIAGVDRLTLNNNKQDPSLVSQHMTYRLFNEAKVHAPRVGFAKVTVNGNYLGVYSNVESVARPYLKDRFGDDSGELLEGTISELSPKTMDRFELKSGKGKSPESWRAMELAKVLAVEEPVTLEAVGRLLDLDSFFSYWAIESLIGFWDGYSANQNNFFVYDNPRDGMLYFMPWGADAAWMSTAGPFGGFGGQGPSSIYSNALLSHRLYQAEGGADRYRQTMTKILQDHWKEEELYAEIKRVGDLLEPHLHPRQSGMRGSQKAMQRFIQTRRKKVQKELDAWPVKIADKPRRPMYAAESGEASGSFQTFWERAPKGESGQAELIVQLDGETVEIKDLNAIAKPFQMFGMGFMAGGGWVPPVVIEITGKRSSDDTKVTLSLSLERSIFENSSGSSASVGGSLMVGEGGGGFGFFGSPNMKWVQGTVDFDQVSVEKNGRVSGKFRVSLRQLKGGFMDQARQ